MWTTGTLSNPLLILCLPHLAQHRSPGLGQGVGEQLRKERMQLALKGFEIWKHLFWPSVSSPFSFIRHQLVSVWCYSFMQKVSFGIFVMTFVRWLCQPAISQLWWRTIFYQKKKPKIFFHKLTQDFAVKHINKVRKQKSAKEQRS